MESTRFFNSLLKVLGVDLLIKAILFGFSGFNINNFTFSSVGYLVFLYVFSFGLLYAFILLIYTKVFVKIIDLIGRKDRVFFQLLLSCIFGFSLHLAVYVLFFFGEWSKSQTIIFHFNGFVLGFLLWLFTKSHLKSSISADS